MTANETTTTTTNISEEDKEILAIELCEEANKIIKQLKEQEDKIILEEATSTISNTNINDNVDNIDEDDDKDNNGENDENTSIEKIEKLFSKAIELDDQCLDAYLGLAYIKGILREYESVMDLLDKAKKIDPTDDRVDVMKQTLEQEILNQEDELDTLGELDSVMDIGNPKINIPLIIINGNVTKKFLLVLREIFDRFDLNKDNCLNKKELQSYSKAVNGQELDLQSYQAIVGSYDANPRNGLTFTGFVELYVNQTIEDSSETLKDLKTLGYDSDLKLIKK